jgi:hypothetical protein
MARSLGCRALSHSASCCGDHCPGSFRAIRAHRGGLDASRQGLGRRAQSNARASARTARYARRPPLRATSRLIADAARPGYRPICRQESPSSTPRDISSRSRRLSDPRLRDQGAGAKPAFAATTPNTEPACLPDARPISLSGSPALHPRQSSVFCSCDKPERPVRAIAGPFSASSDQRWCADRSSPPRYSSATGDGPARVSSTSLRRAWGQQLASRIFGPARVGAIRRM